MFSDNLGAPARREDRVWKYLTLGLVLLLALLMWQGNRIWDHLSGTPRGDELLFCASGQGDLDAIERALDQGANINARSDSELTPLIVACDAGGNAATVQLLLDRGADPNLEAKAGITALYNAVVGDSDEIVEVLLRAGVNPNNKLNGESMLDIAERLNRTRAAKVLRAHGARNATATSLATVGVSASM
jgi:ankyrin repeat protein